ncbi:MAG: UvrD-helicase domain-containing protein [Candidatus Kerfeldbacteria bacterium]
MQGSVPVSVNLEQKKAIQHGDGPLLIVAGAGTGKTTVITQRIAWLILEKKVPTDGVLALTFTDKAATEMEERVDRLLPYGYVNLWISTFHAFCERILREHALDIGVSSDFKLLSQTEQWLLIRRNFDRFDLDYYRPLGNPTRFIAALIKHFSRLEDEDISPEDYSSYARSLRLDRDEEKFTKKHDSEGTEEITEAQRIDEVARAYATYRQLLLDEGNLDFGTLITTTIALFKKRPAILEKYREQFRYILVDEFQDTNWAQYELIKLLGHPRNNVTVVGDDDQSIYKFRGASVSNIIEFRDDYPTCAQIVMTKNYRSRQNILDLAYQFIQRNNPNRLEVALNVPKKGVRRRKKASVLKPVSKRLRSSDRQDGTIAFLNGATQEEEARMVVERIVEHTRKQSVEWREFAILVRANDQAEQFMHALDLAGVPYQFMASKGLYRTPDVLDLVSYLKLLDNYHESPALYRVMNLPSFSIKPDDIVELNAYSRRKGILLYQTLVQHRAVPNLAPATRKGIDELLRMISTGTTYAKNHKVTEVLLEFLKKAGVLSELGKRETVHVLERIAMIRRFLDDITAFEQRHLNATVHEFLEYHQLRLDSGDAGSLAGTSEPDVDAVRIMTVHGAKGLEFSYVFIVQLVDRRFPTTERKEPIDIPEPLIREIIPEGDVHLQEERRLLYVAMTRAKLGLYFTAAEDYGGSRAKRPSRFLYELGFVQEEPKRKHARLAMLERPERKPLGASDIRFTGMKYSFSALRSYEKCPWQFRYAYVLRVPVGGNSLLSYGESMHTTLQRFFQLANDRATARQGGLFGEKERSGTDKQLVTLDELLKLYEESFISDWYENEAQREQFRKRGVAALKQFYEKHAAKLPTVIGLEQGFNLKLGRYTIAGKIDRIDLVAADPATKRNRVRIVDYKSGRSREMEREDKYQLFMYALAVKDPNIYNAEVEKLTYYFLDDGVEADVAYSEKDLETTKGWITSAVEAISAGRFEPTPGMACRYCDYRDICEYRE